MEKELIYKNRSFSSCIQAAYKLLSENTRNIVRCTWLPVLLLSLFSGIFITLNMRDPRLTEVIDKYTTWYALAYFLCIPAIIACSIWAMARLLSMLNGQSRRWNAMRVFILFVCNLLIGVAVGAILGGIGYLLFRRFGSNLIGAIADNWLVVLIVAIVVGLLSLPLVYINMRFLTDKEAQFFPDFAKSYRTGLRHIGFILITCFLTVLIMGIIAFIICIPLTILVTAHTYSMVGYLNGDPIGMPAHFIYLHAGTYAVTNFLVWYVSLFSLMVGILIYGSIEKQKEERQATRLTDNDITDNEIIQP